MAERKQVDRTTREVKPDFESGRGYYWMKQVRELEASGSPVKWPRRPRKNKAEAAFFKQVDQRLSRRAYTVSVGFDASGKIIRGEEV